MAISIINYQIKNKILNLQTLTSQEISDCKDAIDTYVYPVGFFFSILNNRYADNVTFAAKRTYLLALFDQVFDTTYTATERAFLAQFFAMQITDSTGMSKANIDTIVDDCWQYINNVTYTKSELTYTKEELLMQILFFLDSDITNYYSGTIEEIIDELAPVVATHNAVDITALNP